MRRSRLRAIALALSLGLAAAAAFAAPRQRPIASASSATSAAPAPSPTPRRHPAVAAPSASNGKQTQASKPGVARAADKNAKQDKKCKPRKGKPCPPAAPAPCSPRWRPTIPNHYRAAVADWHRPSNVPVRTTAEGRPYLTLEILNANERIEVEPQTAAGRFSASDLDRVAHALRDTRRGNEHPIDPSVIDLIYDIQLHFKANAIRVISGYRTPGLGGHSNHGRGRAVDFIVPGASDEDVAKYARSRGHTGVGTYPSSGFVHVDVRPVSYYWVDNSGPGQRNCERATLGGEARANDSLADAAGRHAPRSWGEPSSAVDSIWGDRKSVRDTEPESHEDVPEEDDLDDDHE